KDSISQAESHYKIALIQFQLGQKEKGLSSLNTIIKKYRNNPWAIQAMNFLNTYETTGILPGTILEETAPLLPGLDGMEEESEAVEGKIEELPPLDDTLPLPELDTTAVQEIPDTLKVESKSILEEIPEQKKKKTTNLDSIFKNLEKK
ncbi:MAG: hypothetical protein KAR38_03630, partial [Calditrichia bacterium]|nr:hypothetical protein [Calditrichia bacterium]